jgi:hypothetical protein
MQPFFPIYKGLNFWFCKGRELLDKLKNYQLYKEDPTLWSWLVGRLVYTNFMDDQLQEKIGLRSWQFIISGK